MLKLKELALEKPQVIVSSSEKRKTLEELVRVYQDLEKTLEAWKTVAEKTSSLKNIYVETLIDKLSLRKNILEEKIKKALKFESRPLKLKLSPE